MSVIVPDALYSSSSFSFLKTLWPFHFSPLAVDGNSYLLSTIKLHRSLISSNPKPKHPLISPHNFYALSTSLFGSSIWNIGYNFLFRTGNPLFPLILQFPISGLSIFSGMGSLGMFSFSGSGMGLMYLFILHEKYVKLGGLRRVSFPHFIQSSSKALVHKHKNN